MEKAKFPFSNPSWYIEIIDPDMYLSRNYAPLDVRLKAYIKYARGIPKMVNDIKGEPEVTAAQNLRRAGHHPIRRIGGVLRQKSRRNICLGHRCRVAKTARRSRRGGGPGHGCAEADLDRGAQQGQ